MSIIPVRNFDNAANPTAAIRDHYRQLLADRDKRKYMAYAAPALVAVTDEPIPQKQKADTDSVQSVVDPYRPRFVFIEEVYAERRALPMKEILLEVAMVFRTHPFDITSARRSRQLARTRFALFHCLRERTQKSLPEIGLFVGGRDHTTVMHGLKRALNLIETDPEFAENIELVRARLERGEV